ncbi:MAG: hypothetical protein ACYCSS_07595 [Sulfuriferula sp.]
MIILPNYLSALSALITISVCQKIPESAGVVEINRDNGTRRERSDALVELTRLCNRSQVGEIAYRLAKAMIGVVDCNEAPDEMTGYTPFERLIEPLQYVLNELL